MAFGQASGPPARAKDITQLAEQLELAGFSSFREARHPFGLTQRQAAGKFTSGEVAELLARLEVMAAGAEPEPDPDPRPVLDVEHVEHVEGTDVAAPNSARADRRRQQSKLTIAGLPDDLMATELELRGWTCIPPL
jgi:hypothetical protein